MKKIVQEILNDLMENIWQFIFFIFSPLLFSIFYLKYSSSLIVLTQTIFFIVLISQLIIARKSFRKFIPNIFRSLSPPTIPSANYSFSLLKMNKASPSGYQIKIPFMIFCGIIFILWTPPSLTLILIGLLSSKYIAFLIGLSSSFIGLGGSILIYAKDKHRFGGITGSLPFFISMICGPPGLIAAFYSLLPNV